MLRNAGNFSLTIFDYSFLKFNKIIFYTIYIQDFYKIILVSTYYKFNYFNYSNYWSYIKRNQHKILYKLLFILWDRIIFRGKGFRVRIFRDNKKITCNFGHSHWTKLLFNKQWDFIKLQRQNYLIFTYFITNTTLLRLVLPKIRLVNRYTLRGLRYRRQQIQKRFGKISQYVSSLH